MSKRTMDIQGGSDRYGGADGPETPDDTPVRANAAQLARRKIAPIKGRAARAKSPVKTGPLFGGFSQGQQDMASQPQPGFSFGQNSASNGFSFGQSQAPQQSASSGFTFGQSQPSASTSFTFGQNNDSKSGGGFNFNAPASSNSFPPSSGNNPFSPTNGTQNGISNGFQGNIFNMPASQTSTKPPQTNGFSFGASPSTTSSSQQDRETASRDIQEREPFLDLAQQKELEDIVGRHLLNSPSLYQQEPLDMLPTEVLIQAANLLRKLPRPPFGATKNVLSLFVKPYRGKSQKPWVTDAQRQEFMATAGKLPPDGQAELAQYVRDNVDDLKNKADHELPGMERLPNDMQYEMIQLAKKNSRDAATPAKAAGPASSTNVGAVGDDKPHIEDVGSTPAKPNPFASIKKSPAAPFAASAPSAPTPSKTPMFSFSQPSAGSEPPKTSGSIFSFNKPAASSTTEAGSKKPTTNGFEMPAAADNAKASSPPAQEAQPKTNPFAAISRPTAGASAPIAKPPSQSGVPENAGAAASTPFKFGQSTAETAPSQAATPAKSPFSFGQSSQTPAAPSSNIFNLGTTVAPSATAPVQKTMPPFSMSGAAAAAPRPTFTTPPQAQSESSPSTQPPPAPAKPAPIASNEGSDSAAGAKFDERKLKTLVDRVATLQAGFRATISTWSAYSDWSHAARFYLREMDGLKRLIDVEEAAIKRGERPSATAQGQASSLGKGSQEKHGLSASNATDQEKPSTSNTPTRESSISSNAPPASTVQFQQGQGSPSPKPPPTFQMSSPQKPLTATASVFSSILDAPDKAPKDTATASPSAAAAPPASSSPFKFQPPSTTSGPSTTTTASPFKFQPPAASSAAPAFSVPKFGGGGGSMNFMSAFGANAQKQADKDKAKRKAEDFDSDEDDEAEWEKQDKEKQEEKKRKLNQQASKVMKNVNGQFVWVDKDEVEKEGSEEGSSSGKGLSQASTSEVAATTTGGSLFNRIGKNDDGSLQKQSEEASEAPRASTSQSIPGSAPKTPSSDKTWKPETPITFAASAEAPGSTTPTGSPAKPLFSFTPKTNGTTTSTAVPATPSFSFGSKPAASSNDAPLESVFGTAKKGFEPPKFVFGSPKKADAAPATSLFSNGWGNGSTPKPASSSGSIFASANTSTGFKFGGPSASADTASLSTSALGSPSTSRATTPGLTENEGSTAATTDNEDATGDAAPAEVQQDLTALSAEELKTEDVLFESKARCRKFTKPGWEIKGIGIIRLLKNKDSGNARVLMRLSPGGQLVINANVMKQKGMYAMMGEKGVKMVFAEADGLSTYTITFGQKESADELLKKVNEYIG